jgi:Protein of unknown function (DUF2909)
MVRRSSVPDLPMRFVIILLFSAILASLGVALVALFAPRGDPNRMVKALTVRIALSVLVFALLLLAWALGLIEPHGLAG